MGNERNYSSNNVSFTVTDYEPGGKRRRVAQDVADLRPYDKRDLDMEGLQQFRFSHRLAEHALYLTQFDDSKDDGDLVVYGAGFTGNMTSMAAKLEIATLGRAFGGESGVPVNVLTLPTAELDGKYAKEMARTGSFYTLAEDVASTLNRVAGDYDRIWVVGHSFGARLAGAIPAAISGKTAQKIDKLIINDPPSAKRALGLVGLGAAQLAETIAMNRCIEESSDTVAQEAWRHVVDGLLQPTPSLRAQLNNIRAMAKAGFVDDLTRSIAVLPQGTQLTLSSPEQSKMNAPDGVHLLAEELSKKYYDLPVRHIGFDRTHNGHAANPALFGEIVKRSLADYSHLPYFDMPR